MSTGIFFGSKIQTWRRNMATPNTTVAAATASFEVYVSKDTFKFNAAHFVAFEGYRERLHGHNYRVGVRLLGQRQIGADGYLIDFGNVKKVTQQVCKRLNEHFLCPMYSNVLTIVADDESVRIECHVDGSHFVFPRRDCAMLPIVHATAEEMAIYEYAEILNGLQAEYLLQRGIHTMEITMAEAVGQEAVFRLAIPTLTNENGSFALDVRQFIAEGKVIPMPCLPDSKNACGPSCSCVAHAASLSDQFTRLAQAINDGSLQADGKPVTADRIQSVINN
jgi:dihydroneopterin triphosphate aldolase (PTPS-III) / 6-pyruvoyltetrahydropterin synthase